MNRNFKQIDKDEFKGTGIRYFKCTNKTQTNITRKTHQDYAMKYFKATRFNGLHLLHKLGSGKTCTSVFIANDILKNTMNLFGLLMNLLKTSDISDTDKEKLKDINDIITRYFIKDKTLKQINLEEIYKTIDEIMKKTGNKNDILKNFYINTLTLQIKNVIQNKNLLDFIKTKYNIDIDYETKLKNVLDIYRVNIEEFKNKSKIEVFNIVNMIVGDLNEVIFGFIDRLMFLKNETENISELESYIEQLYKFIYNIKIITKVYVITTGALRENWLTEFCTNCGGDKVLIQSKNFIFMTYNFTGKETIKKIENELEFNRSMFIIDEVHNFINTVKNNKKLLKKDVKQSLIDLLDTDKEEVKNEIGKSSLCFSIYEKIIKSNNVRVLTLSGTLLYKSTDEFPILMNLLNPKSKTLKFETGFLHSFFKLESDTNTYIFSSENKKKDFITEYSKLISYYPGDTKDYPEVINKLPIITRMTELQEIEFFNNIELEDKLKNFKEKDHREKKLDKKTIELMKKLKIVALLNIFTKKATNCTYPIIFNKIPDNLGGNDDENGWINNDNVKIFDIKYHSPKILSLLKNIISVENFAGTHVVYSVLKNKSGVNLIYNLIKLCLGKDLRVEMFSGDVDDKKRTEILETFNSKDNINGEKIKILFITKAGAEGITLKNVQHLHLLESEKRSTLTDQVIGRIARLGSHKDLKKQYKKVTVWRYWSTADSYQYTPKIREDNEIITKPQKEGFVNSSDIKLYMEGIKHKNEMSFFMSLFDKTCIENLYNIIYKNDYSIDEKQTVQTIFTYEYNKSDQTFKLIFNEEEVFIKVKKNVDVEYKGLLSGGKLDELDKLYDEENNDEIVPIEEIIDIDGDE